MKGLSMLLSVALLFTAHLLARHLKKSGTLPAVRQKDELRAMQTIGQSNRTAKVPMPMVKI
jgi:hypothetical protein